MASLNLHVKADIRFLESCTPVVWQPVRKSNEHLLLRCVAKQPKFTNMLLLSTLFSKTVVVLVFVLRSPTDLSKRCGPAMSCLHQVEQGKSFLSPRIRSKRLAMALQWHCAQEQRLPTLSLCNFIPLRCTIRECLGRCCQKRCAATAHSFATSTANVSLMKCFRVIKSVAPWFVA